MKIRHLIMLGLLTGILAGCTPKTLPDPTAETTVGGADDMDGASGVDDDSMDDGTFFEDDRDDSLVEQDAMTMVIYFDFDQSELRPEYADLLAAHAARLASSSRTSMRLEGHADERGSREYNIGLGERRSQTVRRMLLIQGGSSDQISTVSFGEERPAAFGSDEESYELNRRVEIKYTQ